MWRNMPDLVLDDVTSANVTTHHRPLRDEELNEAFDAVAAQQAKKRAKRKKK